MIINLTRLFNNIDQEIVIDETINIDEELIKTTEIRKLSPIRVIGNIIKDIGDTYLLNMTINGEMILPCAISLKDVSVPFNIEVYEILSENVDNNEEYIKIINNSIDIMPIIWQNIVVEIPLRVVSPKAKNVKLEGNGWKLLNEEEIKSELDPRLSKLKDLLDE